MASKLKDIIELAAKKIAKSTEETASKIGSKAPGKMLDQAEQEAMEDIFQMSPSMKKMAVEEQATIGKPETGLVPTKPNFELKGEPYKNPNLPVESMPRMPTKTGAEVIEGEFRDVTPPSPLVNPPVPWYKDPKKVGTILAGTGALGLALAPGGSDQPPMAPKLAEAPPPPKENLVKKIQAKIQTPKKKLPVEQVKSPEIKAATGDEILDPKTGQNVNLPADNRPEVDIGEGSFDPLKAFKEAQDDRDSQVMWNQLGQISERGAAAMGGFKPLYGDVYEGNIKRAEQKIEDIKNRIALEENDPNSPTSQAFRKYVEKYGGVKIKGALSASTAKELLPKVYGEFKDKLEQEAKVQAAREAEKFKAEESDKLRKHQEFLKQLEIDARKETARIAAEARKTEKEQRREDANDKWISQRYDKIIASKPYQAYSKIDRAQTLVEEAVKNPSGFGDIATLYSAITALDPDSVVREGEIKLSKDAASLWGNISTGLTKLGSNPRVIPDALLRDMHKYIKSIHRQAKDQYNTSIGPVVEQAKSRNIPEERFIEIDPMYKRSQPKVKEQAKVQSEKSPEVPAQQLQGLIKVRRKSDGAVKTLTADKAAKYLADPKFERVE